MPYDPRVRCRLDVGGTNGSTEYLLRRGHPDERVCATRSVLLLGGVVGADRIRFGDNERKWAAVMSRFSMAAAVGEHQLALTLVDSAVASGMNAALGLYFLGAAAGIDPGTRVDEFVKQLDAAIDSRPAPSLWLLTLWSARTADTTRLARVRARLAALKATNGTRLDTLIADVAAAYDALARRDTSQALAAFGKLSPRAGPIAVQGTLWESLAPERLTLARLLMATGKAAETHRVASMFDQPGLYLNPLFLRPSLELRVAAARALGDDALRRAAEDRLRQLTPVSR